MADVLLQQRARDRRELLEGARRTAAMLARALLAADPRVEDLEQSLSRGMPRASPSSSVLIALPSWR